MSSMSCLILWARSGCKLARRSWQASLVPHAAGCLPGGFSLFRREVPGDDSSLVRQPFTLGTANGAVSKLSAEGFVGHRCQFAHPSVFT